MSVTAIGTGAAASLVKLISGEYTAASVNANPKEALKLGLIKQPDGNYGPPPAAASAGKSSSGVLMKLSAMTLGGI